MNPEVHIKTEGNHSAGDQDNQGYTPNLDSSSASGELRFNPVTFHNVSQLGKYFVFTNLLQSSSIYTIPKLPIKDGTSPQDPVLLGGSGNQPIPLNNAITIPTSVIGENCESFKEDF